MHKNQESSQNFAAGARVWFFCCILFLLSLSACNLPTTKEGVPGQVPPAIIQPSPSATIMPLDQVPPITTLSFPLSTPTALATSQVPSTPKLSSPPPTTIVLPVNQESPTATLSSPFPNSAKAKFSISSANYSLPEDVLREIRYFGSGGAGESAASTNRELFLNLKCSDNICAHTWYSSCESKAYSMPELQLNSKNNNYELAEETVLNFCGWQNKEEIILTILYPNGNIDIETLKAPDIDDNLQIRGIGFGFWPHLKSPVGTYTFVLTGSNQKMETSINIKEPSGARVYEKRDLGLFLYNFLPNEKVRLFAYKSPDFNTGELIGWQTYQTDHLGQLFIETIDPYDYGVIGETSGEVHATFITFYPGFSISTIKNPCPGAPPIRLTLDKKARVTITTGSSLRVRQSPGILGKEINKLKEGTVIDVMEGPVCADRMNWWKLKSKDGITGWSAEGDLKGYNLEPWN
jgi:hypothetical protein